MASAHARPSQEKTKHIGIRVSPEVSKQLHQIALNKDGSVEVLLGEAIDRLFHSHRLPTIASKQEE